MYFLLFIGQIRNRILKVVKVQIKTDVAVTGKGQIIQRVGSNVIALIVF